MEKGRLFCILIVVAGLICFISIFLLAYSFSKIEMNQVGIRQNIHSKAFEDNTVYKPGRYYTGLVNTFITYPTTLQYIKFGSHDGPSNEGPISTKTKDRSEITISCGFSYRLISEEIKKLYDKYPSKNHQNQYILQAKRIVIAKMDNYDLAQFYTKRREIAYALSYDIGVKLQEEFAQLVDFQLFEIRLPQRIETSLTNQQISDRTAQTKQVETEIKNIEGQMTVAQSRSNQEVSQINSDSSQQGNKIVSNLEAEGLDTLRKQENTQYNIIKTDLSFTDQNLFMYIYLNKLMDQSSDQLSLIVGIDKGLVNIS